MITLPEWEHEIFINSSYEPDITVIFPSREIYFSPRLLDVMRFSSENCPKTLDQWFELCHPEDHAKASQIEREIYSHGNFFSLTRKLYCGDGHYRNFRLDAFVQRNFDGQPIKLLGRETFSLEAWLATANDGDKIKMPNGKIFEAVRISGSLVLKDIGELSDIQRENEILRRELQKKIFSGGRAENFSLNDFSENDTFIKNALETNINASLNILMGNENLKTIRKNINETDFFLGVAGLSGSGKTFFVNALLGEQIIPQKNFPVFCRNGETRTAKVFYHDGQTKIFQDIKKAFDGTGISRIEITIPGARIPEGICVVDTSGLDMLTGAGVAELKKILPELDAIFYVTPVRSRLKGSDLEFLREILNMTGEINFVLSQIDLERGDTEAGEKIFSASEKISEDIRALKYDAKKFLGISDAKVFPVSAKNALENFYSPQISGWKNSGFDAVINYMKNLGENSFTRALTLRMSRVLKIINGQKLYGSSKWRLGEISEILKKILAAVDVPKIFVDENFCFGEEKNETEPHEKNLLSSLIISMKEREFASNFFALDALSGKNKIILLGAEKNQSIKLFSRLAHNIRLENLPDGGASFDEWLCSGTIAPFGCIMLPVINPEKIFLIAPADKDLLRVSKNFDWRKILDEYAPVVSVDLARLNSGLADLLHAPYITELALKKWVLAFGNAGLFDTRQIDLVSKVGDSVRDFVRANGLKEPDWFIFEGYKIF